MISTTHQASKGRGDRRSEDRAFSLVESLVVIGIIVILIALLVPAFSTFQQSVSVANCTANLRRIGEGVRLYSNENSGFLPKLAIVPTGQNELLMTLREYLGAGENDYKSTTVVKSWICPGDPTRGGWKRAGALHGIEGDERLVGILAHSYLANRLVLGYRQTEISRPSQSILMADYPWGKLYTRAISPEQSPWKENFPTEWHRGNINCLFVDGHVELLPIKSLIWGESNSRLWYADYPNSGTKIRN